MKEGRGTTQTHILINHRIQHFLIFLISILKIILIVFCTKKLLQFLRKY